MALNNPAHVAVFDPGTATGINNIIDAINVDSWSGVALKGAAFDSTKPIRLAMGHLQGTSDGTNGFTTGLTLPGGTTSILGALPIGNPGGYFLLPRGDISTLTSCIFQTRTTAGAAVVSTAYDFFALVFYQI